MISRIIALVRPMPLMFAWLTAAGAGAAPVQPESIPLTQQRWFETRTAHFNVYSSAAPQEVYGLAAHLEQFTEAYSLLAGAQAVSSPPIIVLAFPDRDALLPFLPLYQGKPANLAGFFKRSNENNLIVLALPSTNSAFTGMEVIFHEYTHLLFRRNARLWPLWLIEGMAEVYSTFETTGYTVRIGKPIEPYLSLLAQRPLLPLRELFAVTHDSPHYNESERQGMFYAESWLLTHYLMAGGALAYKARFEQFTRLLREGQIPEQAFTNALQTTLSQMETELRHYLERNQFAPIQWALPMNLSAAKPMAARALTPVEVYFRLGAELLQIDRLEAAEDYFNRALKLAPASPLPYEGLGLLAVRREQHGLAARRLKEALQRGSTSYLAHYYYAQEKYRLTADSGNRYASLEKEPAAEIRGELQKAIALMPSYGPAHHLLGFFETVQGDDFVAAEKQLQLAIQLEPENPSYLIALAQAQVRNHEPEAARRTLAPLFLPGADMSLRKPAEELMKEIGRPRPK